MSTIRIVCAANKVYLEYTNKEVLILGVRHFDARMNQMYRSLGIDVVPKTAIIEVQGFITSSNQFLTRTEAWIVATNANQIIRRVGGDTADGGTLFSENLY